MTQDEIDKEVETTMEHINYSPAMLGKEPRTTSIEYLQGIVFHCEALISAMEEDEEAATEKEEEDNS